MTYKRPKPYPKDTQNRPDRYTIEENGVAKIRPALIDAEAREEAKKCNKVSDTQMRRFFGATKAERVKSNSEAKVLMAVLKAKAHYAAARDSKNKTLADFFGHHAKLIQTSDDFHHFVQHFEAVIAYHKFNQKVRQ